MRELEGPIKILMGENGDDLFKLYVYLNHLFHVSTDNYFEPLANGQWDVEIRLIPFKITIGLNPLYDLICLPVSTEALMVDSILFVCCACFTTDIKWWSSWNCKTVGSPRRIAGMYTFLIRFDSRLLIHHIV